MSNEPSAPEQEVTTVVSSNDTPSGDRDINKLREDIFHKEPVIEENSVENKSVDIDQMRNDLLGVEGNKGGWVTNVLEESAKKSNIHEGLNIEELRKGVVDTQKGNEGVKGIVDDKNIGGWIEGAHNANDANDKVQGQESLIERLKKEKDLAKIEARTDHLTGVYNRKFFEEYIRERSKDTKTGFAIIMLDVDYFKNFNDTFGHQSGDKALQLVAERLKESARKKDLVARWGGEEFVVVVDDPENVRTVREIGERIRSVIEETSDKQKQKGSLPGNLTVSVGCAISRPDDGIDWESILSRSDQALYAAKGRGKNRVIFCDNYLGEGNESIRPK